MRAFNIYLLILLTCVLSCTEPSAHAPAEPGATNPNLIVSYAMLEPHFGQEVTLRGIYCWHDPGQIPPGQQPRYSGHVAIELLDGWRVLLLPPADTASIRPRKELLALKNQLVQVTGVVQRFVPVGVDPETGKRPEIGTYAMSSAPCMVSLRGIVRE